VIKKVLLVTVAMPSVTVTVLPGKEPESVKLGARWMFPVPVPVPGVVVVTVMNAGPTPFANVNA
jgi:hypothetical protein